MNYLAIDLGGTEIKYALMSQEADILEKSKVPSPPNIESTTEMLVLILKGIISEYESQIKGVALSLPGILNSDTGDSYTAGMFHYLSGQNLPELLQKHFDLPITVENDGKAAALAELWKGSLSGVKNGAVVVLGTAVGGGLAIGGELYKGNTFAAGEMSFILTNPEKDTYWGATGGSSHLIKLASEKLGIPLVELNGYKVFEMAEAGQQEVLEVLDEYTRNIAYQLYNLQTLLDLDLIAIGGGISRQPLLLAYLQKNIDEYCDNHPFKPFMPRIPRPKITTCKYFNQANLIGALYHHLKLTTKGAKEHE